MDEEARYAETTLMTACRLPSPTASASGGSMLGPGSNPTPPQIFSG